MLLKPIITSTLILMLLSIPLSAAHISWEKVNAPDTEGYTIHYGSESGKYDVAIDVGNVGDYDLKGLNNGTYYFSMTSRDKWGNVSTYTEELMYSVGDMEAPELLSVSQVYSNEVELIFSEILDPKSAEDINNYKIFPNVAVLEARLNEEGTHVTLVTGLHTSGNYLVTVTGLFTEKTAVPIADNTCLAYQVQTTGVDAKMGGPVEFSLGRNFPNPFNPSTTIEYSIKEPGHVRLIVFNLRGESVRTLIDQEVAFPGNQRPISWDGANEYGHQVASGMYFYRLESGSDVQTMRMQLVR